MTRVATGQAVCSVLVMYDANVNEIFNAKRKFNPIEGIKNKDLHLNNVLDHLGLSSMKETREWLRCLGEDLIKDPAFDKIGDFELFGKTTTFDERMELYRNGKNLSDTRE